MYKKLIAFGYLVIGVIGFAVYMLITFVYGLFSKRDFIYRGKGWGKWF